MMERTNVLRQVSLFLALGAWAFLLLSLGSFHSTDWPSHTVYPWPATQNLCGTAGAFVHHLVVHERLAPRERARLRKMLAELDRKERP